MSGRLWGVAARCQRAASARGVTFRARWYGASLTPRLRVLLRAALPALCAGFFFGVAVSTAIAQGTDPYGIPLDDFVFFDGVLKGGMGGGSVRLAIGGDNRNTQSYSSHPGRSEAESRDVGQCATVLVAPDPG